MIGLSVSVGLNNVKHGDVTRFKFLCLCGHKSAARNFEDSRFYQIRV